MYVYFLPTSPPDTQPTLLQLTYMVAPSGKEVRIIKNIAAKWKEVGALFNFDPTGYTIDLIDTHNQSKPMACCTDTMKVWLGGRGRKPISWATLVEVLRNAEFNVLADEVDQLVSTHGGRVHFKPFVHVFYLISLFFFPLSVPVLSKAREGHGVEEKEDIDWEGDQSFLLPNKDGESSGEGGRRERRECQCCEIL